MGKPLCFLLLLIFKLSSLCAQDAVHVWLDHKGRVQLEQITGKPYEVSLWSNYRYHAEDGVYNILNHTIGGADSAVNIITIPRDTSMSYWRKRFYDFLGFDWDRWRFTFGYPDIPGKFWRFRSLAQYRKSK